MFLYNLRISTRISEKIEMTLMLFSGALGKMIHEKNLQQKVSLHCPFKSTSYKVAHIKLNR